MGIIFMILQLFSLVLLARVLLSWFPNIDHSNPLVKLLHDVTEPILAPIRQAMPQTNGVDFSPMVAILGVYVLEMVLRTAL